MTDGLALDAEYKETKQKMSFKPIIVVTGATGQQGGSVVRFLLADGGFQVRAITRNVDSPAAVALKEKGVEVVQATFDDVESLKKALKGAYGAFVVTNFWDPSIMSEEKEFQQGKNIVDAAKEVGGIQHLIFSTLEEYDECEHFNAKARINEYLIKSGLPRTSVYTDFYFENFASNSLMGIKKVDGGKLVADWPLLKSDGPIPGYAVGDTGGYALGAFKDPKKWIGKDVKIIAEIFTPRQFIAALEEIGGVKIEYKEVNDSAFNAFAGVPDVKEIYLNMRFFYETDGKMNRTPEEVDAATKLYPQQLGVKGFVKANLDKLIPK